MIIDSYIRSAFAIKNELGTDLEETILVVKILVNLGFAPDKIQYLAESGALFIWSTWDDIIEDTFMSEGFPQNIHGIDDVKIAEYISLLRRTNSFFALSENPSDRKAKVLEITYV